MYCNLIKFDNKSKVLILLLEPNVTPINDFIK